MPWIQPINTVKTVKHGGIKNMFGRALSGMELIIISLIKEIINQFVNVGILKMVNGCVAKWFFVEPFG